MKKSVYFWLIFGITASGQIVNKVLVSGLGGQHDIDVQTSFEMGYSSYDGSSFPGITTRQYASGISTSLTYAKNNNYELLIRSTTGLSNAITHANSYPEVQVVMPAGSNSYNYVYSGDVASCPIIITGAGDAYNETGYSVEFYAPDPITIEPDYSSFSNGFIAGQIAYLANTLNISLNEARVLARQSIAGESPDVQNGYGQISVEDAINSVLPVELGTFAAYITGNNVTLTWTTLTEINNYGFEIESITPLPGSDQGSFPREGTGGVWETIGFVAGAGNSNSSIEYSFVDADVSSGKILYRLKQIDSDGSFNFSEIISIETGLIIPKKFVLSQNFPNPFNPSTNFGFQIANYGLVTLNIYDILGNKVSELVNEEKEPGSYEINFNASNLTSGIYFYTLQAGSYTETKSMILLK